MNNTPQTFPSGAMINCSSIHVAIAALSDEFDFIAAYVDLRHSVFRPHSGDPDSIQRIFNETVPKLETFFNNRYTIVPLYGALMITGDGEDTSFVYTDKDKFSSIVHELSSILSYGKFDKSIINILVRQNEESTHDI